MNRTLMGLLAVAVTVGATAAHADDFRGRHRHRGPGHQARPVLQHDCGPRPTVAPAGTSFAYGQYQLQAVQRWVPGQPQQVWVPGQCHGRFNQRCTPGHYRWVTSAGHYETVQQWVWVPSSYPQPQYGYGSHGYGSYGYDTTGATYGATYGDGSAHAQVGVHVGYSTF